MTSPLIYSILLLLSTWEISSTTPTEAYEDASWIESSYSNGYKDSSHHTDGTGYNLQDNQEGPSHTGESVSTSSSNGGGGPVLTPFNPKLWNIFKLGAGNEGAMPAEIEGFELSGLGIWNGVLGIYSVKKSEEPEKKVYITEKPYEEEYTTEKPYEKEYTTEKPYEKEYTTEKPYEREYTTEKDYTTEKPYTTEEVHTENPHTTEVHTEEPYTPEQLKQENFATALIGGCSNEHPVPETVPYHPQSLSCGIPNSPFTSCGKQAGAFINDSVVVCGSDNNSDKNTGSKCYKFCLDSSKRDSYENEWKSFPSLNKPREHFTLNTVGNSLVAVGGFKAECEIEIYENDKWCKGPNVPDTNGLFHHCSVSYGEDKLMIIGGFNDGHPTNAVNTFDLASHSVHKFAPLNKNRYSHSCIAAVMEGKEYVFAAGGFESYHVSNTVEYLAPCDVQSNDDNYGNYEHSKWKHLAPMNIRRYDFSLSIYGTQLAAFGGQPTIKSEEIEVYNEHKQCWEKIGRSLKNHERHYFSSFTIPKDKCEVINVNEYY